MTTTNLDKLRAVEHYSDYAKNPNDEVFKLFMPNSDYDPLFSQVFALAGYKVTDITTPTSFISRHAKQSLKAMAHHLISVIFHVKRGLKNKKVSMEDKMEFIDHFMGEFGNVTNGMFYDDIAYLSSPTETHKARDAFMVAAEHIKNGEYGTAIFKGIIELLNILINSLNQAETGEFMNIDFIDLVEMAIFDTNGALVKMMVDESYKHQTNCLAVWIGILNNSPYLLWIKINETGVVRAYDMQEAIGLYRVMFDGSFDSSDLRLKRRAIFGDLNLAYGTHDTAIPTTKPKTINKNTKYFKKKHKYAKQHQNTSGNQNKVA